MDSIQDYAIYLLAPDGTVQSWNLGAKRLKGYTADEIVGRHFETFFSTQDRAAGKPGDLLARALAEGATEDLGWRYRKDGSQFWASALITPLRRADGQHVGFAKVTRDLTDRSYRSFVETTNAIVWTTDAAGAPNADSPSWRQFTGQSERDWRESRAWDPVHPDELPVLEHAWTQAKVDRARFRAEFRLRRADGEYVWMEARALPLFDGHGELREWFGVTFDISAAKHAERSTLRALELWKTTLSSIGDAVISTDHRGDVRFMNAVAEQLTGWTAADAERRPLAEVFQIFNEDTGACVDNPVARVLQDGLVVGLANHTVLRSRAGREVPIADSAAPIRDPDGTIEGVVLVFRDVTEEKRELLRRSFLTTATEKLYQARDHVEALGEIASLAVPRLADFCIVHVVDAARSPPLQVAVAHVDPTKASFARDLALRYPTEREAAWGTPRVLRTGEAELHPDISPAQLESRATDAAHLALMRELEVRSAMIVPLRNQGPVFGAITFVLTGTERRYDEADLALAEDLAKRVALIVERRIFEEEAARANRLKDEFLATISHELRTPLNAILGYAAMLRSGVARDVDKALEVIERNAAAQSRLIDDILDVASITSGKLRVASEHVHLAAVVRAALDAVRPAADARQIALVETLAADLGDIKGDADRIQQVIWNLLSNAVKFTDPGGRVEVAGRRAERSVQIIVRDTGKGIPAEHLGTIFERFRQLDSSITRRQGGLGLGLAIARNLVEAHGGTLTAESDGPGHGSSFIVTLPAHVDALLRSRTPLSLEAVRAPLDGIRVLLVDDDDDTRDLLAELIGVAGGRVVSAASAEAAYLALRAEPPDVLISDVGMPGEDGYSLLRRIRALPPGEGGDVPAIALTAYGRIEDVRAAMDAGFQVHLVKPIKPQVLLSTIATSARPR